MNYISLSLLFRGNSFQGNSTYNNQSAFKYPDAVQMLRQCLSHRAPVHIRVSEHNRDRFLL